VSDFNSSIVFTTYDCCREETIILPSARSLGTSRVNMIIQTAAMVKTATVHSTEKKMPHQLGQGELRWATPYIRVNGESTTVFYYNVVCRDCGRLFVESRGPTSRGGLARCEDCRRRRRQAAE